ncbi:MAG: PDZ domain-containing protein [candidate division Zixibacteria bacterium]|nr:PDZ domain-containing protein [candidate division Zixibacteria bacterium]
MNRFFCWLIMAVAVSAIAGNAIAADPDDHHGGMKVMTFEKGSVHFLNELGAMIVSEDGQLTVQMVSPSADRVKQYQTVDLRANDRILMLNGKKMTSIQDLDEGYRVIEVGEDVKFAIKRDDMMMITSFPKADLGDQSGTHTMVMQTTSDLPVCQSGDTKTTTKTISFGGNAGEIMPVLDAGIILTEDGDKVKIMALLPNAAELFKDNSVRDGDIVLSLQDKDISSSAEFSDIFDQISIGDKVELRISRSGTEMDILFDKPESPANMNINIGN